MARRPGKLRIGTSGYQYDDWRGRFYPKTLPKSAWFAHYAERFDAVEINATFYRLPEAATFERWRDAAPKGFCYALKFSRYGTHLKRLKDAADTIGLFIGRARLLGPSLGPILVQLPPRWRVNVARLAGFLESTPKQYRWAVEFRDPSWLCEDIYALLRKHRAALCIHDLIRLRGQLFAAGPGRGGSAHPQKPRRWLRRLRLFQQRHRWTRRAQCS
jgi:uncharacterized protein YecE (DUF72 family)